jgi:hypothetical protein
LVVAERVDGLDACFGSGSWWVLRTGDFAFLVGERTFVVVE